MSYERIYEIARQGIKVVIGLSIVATFIANVFPQGELYISEKHEFSDISESRIFSDVTDTSASDSDPEPPASSAATASAASDVPAEEKTPQTAAESSPQAAETTVKIASESAFSAPEEPKAESSAPAVTSVSGLININTATSEQLKTLNGIGDVKAQAIIDYRTEHGGFSSVDELINVKGIGEKTLEKIRAGVTV